MTFSIIGHCDRTDMFGVAITTSSISVGARCPHVRAGVGAVATQNVTNPDLGPQALDALSDGMSSADALAHVLRTEQHPSYRQVTVIDLNGTTATHTGENILGTNAVVVGDHCVAAGNLLQTKQVPQAMADGFSANAECHLAERLLRALEAGVAAGGEEGPTHSAALLVADTQPFPLVDLRVDWADEEAIPALRKIWENYKPQMQAYLDRAVNPSAAPSYGVPGDE